MFGSDFNPRFDAMSIRNIISTIAVSSLLCAAACSKKPDKPAVVVYTSVDDVFARPVAEQFEKSSGIAVKLVPDTEETKSAGLLNRLIVEKDRPQCDVFWSGDPVRAGILKSKGVSAPYESPAAAGLPQQFSDPDKHFVSFSTRARVIIYNTTHCPAGQEPKSVRDLIDPKWKGRTCIANPLFGTTSMHAAAWFETMGEEGAKTFFEALAANGVKVLSSNGEVKRRVAAGDFAFGLTDTDDAIGAMQENKPVNFTFPDQDREGTLLVPNAAVFIAGAPNAENGRKFIDYLLSPTTEAALAAGDAAQIPLRSGVAGPAKLPPLDKIKAMPVDYSKLAARLDALQSGFLKDWVAKQL
jgi:iron(III) transport system substrate-binding protein